MFRVSFPANSNFELGRGSNFSDWRPQLVPSLKSIRVIQVACGGYHSLALTGKLLEPAKSDLSRTSFRTYMNQQKANVFVNREICFSHINY